MDVDDNDCHRREEWVAAIRHVAARLSAGEAPGAPAPLEDGDMGQLGTSHKDKRKVVSIHSPYYYVSHFTL
ncbi:hypothetical protein EVAR_22601_1 [Eumeta japonica]|uniref:PH domain-containing protein n=1 Tax=Eumeta variegata TaxID=151549 RepID=A0A4C1U7H1_EUMVA|nr:hypothetical protein EVAR_22601_1 [Eumeta japonica]